jgi:hypothetical protein
VTGLAPEEARPVNPAAMARNLMAAHPGAWVDVIPRHDGPGLCARIPYRGGHAMAIGATREVADWVADNYKDGGG